jgi:type I restriction enzyme S subunit
MLDAARNVGVEKPYLGNRAVQWGRIDIEELPRAPMTQPDLKRFRLEPGDLLVCEGGEIGRAAIWESPISECYYQKALHRLRPTRGYSVFLMMALLRLWTTTGHLANFVGQTSIAHLPKAKLELVPLPVPPPPEQCAIAEALSDVDRLITALGKLIAKKRTIKQAAMHQLLTGEMRLPGFSGDWTTRQLGDFGHWRGGSTPLMSNSVFWSGGDIPWLSSSDVRQGWINDSSSKITQRAVNDTSVPIVKPGSVIVVVRSGILRRFLPVACNSQPVAINQDLRALEPGPHHHPQFIQHALIKCERRLLVDCLKAGTTVESIDSAWFRGFRIPIPPLDEQRAIAKALSDMDAEIAALECRQDKTKQIKLGMMQQLLTGRIRLVKQSPQEEAEDTS